MPFENYKQSIYHRHGDFPWQTMDGETIIVEPKTQMSHEINEVGTLVWKLLDGQNSLESIQDQIVEHFEVDPTIARQDLENFINQLVAKGLIHCL